MEPFKIHRGRIATLDRSNVDTDQIIPKQFLKSIQRTGFGESLFFDWRYLPDGKPNPDFGLNHARFRGASILIVRNNFGCGSSREHAVWALQQYGFRAVLASRKQNGALRIPAFADIFRTNSFKNGLLTIELSETEVDEIFKAVEAKEGLEATVDLERQEIKLHAAQEATFHFDLDPAIRHKLLHGLDDIGVTLEQEPAIRTFEARHEPQLFKH